MHIGHAARGGFARAVDPRATWRSAARSRPAQPPNGVTGRRPGVPVRRPPPGPLLHHRYRRRQGHPDRPRPARHHPEEHHAEQRQSPRIERALRRGPAEQRRHRAWDRADERRGGRALLEWRIQHHVANNCTRRYHAGLDGKPADSVVSAQPADLTPSPTLTPSRNPPCTSLTLRNRSTIRNRTRGRR